MRLFAGVFEHQRTTAASLPRNTSKRGMEGSNSSSRRTRWSRRGSPSVIAAVFTYRLGVAGTLIGMELTTVVITLSSAIFKAQLMMASHHLASLRKRCGPVLRTADSHPQQSEHRTEPGAVHARQGQAGCSACAPCQASSESYRPSRGLGYSSLACSPGC